jgi:hypothetical protein
MKNNPFFIMKNQNFWHYSMLDEPEVKLEKIPTINEIKKTQSHLYGTSGQSGTTGRIGKSGFSGSLMGNSFISLAEKITILNRNSEELLSKINELNVSGSTIPNYQIKTYDDFIK